MTCRHGHRHDGTYDVAIDLADTVRDAVARVMPPGNTQSTGFVEGASAYASAKVSGWAISDRVDLCASEAHHRIGEVLRRRLILKLERILARHQLHARACEAAIAALLDKDMP